MLNYILYNINNHNTWQLLLLLTWCLRLSEGDADVSKHVAVLMTYIILFLYICTRENQKVKAKYI